ncbi:hypothetical protein RND81_14G027300 [Saponaria officinalis]|uniref:Uncharacterized protein n=1 Tax=Saponaria officinalis TaxID=3572 RepID=A0AAW1GKE9_SAPOF
MLSATVFPFFNFLTCSQFLVFVEIISGIRWLDYNNTCFKAHKYEEWYLTFFILFFFLPFLQLGFVGLLRDMYICRIVCRSEIEVAIGRVGPVMGRVISGRVC